jgi:prevent-host-death family protein
MAVHSNSVGAYEAKTRFSELLERVASGDEITITKHGMPVARLVPVRTPSTAQQRRTAIDRMRALASSLTLQGTTVKQLIEEGRR